MPRLLSVNVGLPREVTWNGKTVRTAIWKSRVEGRRMVRKLNIAGDGQGDLAGHGGEQRAVFVFTLRPGKNPVVLLSAGVGATPVISMLHALVAEKSQREIWWIYGARNLVDHPFAKESRSLLEQLSRGRGYIVYSRAGCN